MKKIALFGGSFDPVHFGHLNLAIEVLEKARLDEIIFCPAYISPFKVEAPPKASAKQRLEMVKLAIEGIKKFSVTDEEIKRNEISYTIETLRSFSKKFEGKAELSLIIDQDLTQKFCNWKDCNQIFDYATVIIGLRSTYIEKNLPPVLSSASNKKIIITSQFEISSTLIRDRLAAGAYCGHLVPAKVLDYIYKHDLY